MARVVGIRFKKAGKIYFFLPGNLQLLLNDYVIVETARGMEFGQIALPQREITEDQVISPLKTVLRKATPEDLVQNELNQQKEKDAFKVCQEKISQHQLPMKLIDVEYTFDGNKLIFSFAAEGRVDFRELVKDLASIFRTRIELRQIGVRDEAKMLGGYGSCGRELCCASFLGDFEPVSIRMAKGQNLSLNPAKISGICGRLMCCLKFESGSYESGPLQNGQRGPANEGNNKKKADSTKSDLPASGATEAAEQKPKRGNPQQENLVKAGKEA